MVNSTYIRSKDSKIRSDVGQLGIHIFCKLETNSSQPPSPLHAYVSFPIRNSGSGEKQVFFSPQEVEDLLVWFVLLIHFEFSIIFIFILQTGMYLVNPDSVHPAAEGKSASSPGKCAPPSPLLCCTPVALLPSN